MKTLLIALTVLSLNTFAAEATPPSGFQVGVSFSGHSSGSGMEIDIAPPTLFRFSSHGEKTKSLVRFYFNLAEDRFQNLAQVSGNFFTTNNLVFGGGLKAQTFLAEGTNPFSPYVYLGAELSLVDNKLSVSNTSWGMRVGWGADFFFLRGEDTLLGLTDSSFFADGSLVFFHQEADLIGGSPKYRDGFIARIGFRSHF